MAITQVTKLWAKREDDGNTSLTAILKSADFEEGTKVFIPDLSAEATIESLFGDVFTLLNGGSLGPDFIVHDTFTDANGTIMTSHTPDEDELGGGYSQYFYYDDGMVIQDNRVEWEMGDDGRFYIDVGLSDNVIAEIDFTAPDTQPDNFGSNLALHLADYGVDSFSYDGYIYWNKNTGDPLDVHAVIRKEGLSKVDNLIDTADWDLGETHTLKFSLVAGVLTLYIDDVEKATWTEDGVPMLGTFVVVRAGISYYSSTFADNFKVYAA